MSDSLVHATSGAAGGIVAMACTYPLINISTRAQVETSKHPNETIIDAVRNILKREGLLGLYDGLSSSLLGIAVTNGIYYLFFEETRAILLRTKQAAASSGKNVKAQLSTLESIFASFIAGCATSIISNPIWVINTRQTVSTTIEEGDLSSSTSSASGSKGPARRTSSSSQPRKRKIKLGFVQTLLHIIKTDGWKALFHGLGPALVLVINPILQYTLFEQLKNALLLKRASALAAAVPKSATEPPLPLPLGDWDFFWLGAVSKLFATGITYPYLTVKSRMQSGQKEGRSYTSSWDGVKRIVKAEGPEGLYRGIGTKLTQSVLTAAILFMSKEKIYLATKKALATAAEAAP